MARQNWFASRPQRSRKPRCNASHGLIGSSFARRLRVEALEDRRMLAVTLDFTGGYEMQNWALSGIAGGSTSIDPVSGTTDTADFAYNVTLPNGSGVSRRMADFTLANSLVTGSVTFDYTYSGNHRYFFADASFSTLVGGTSTNLVSSQTSGDFNFSGSATLVARAGQSFGFRIGGYNKDADSHIDGTLTITNFVAHDSIVVDSVSDTVDGNYSPGNLTLREAVELANTIPGDDSITFDPSMSGQTILLTGAHLEITETLTIDAAALAENVTLDAQQQSRVMNFEPATGDLTLAGLRMQNGRTTGGDNGGGIQFRSSGTLTLTECILSGNSTTGDFADGGGIDANSGNVTLNNCTLSGNSTAGLFADGGGISTFEGDVRLTNTTLSDNSTSGQNGRGGGIFTSSGDVTLTGSTLSGNSTEGDFADGGGIYSNSGDVMLTGSTLSGNSTAGSSSDGGGIFSDSGDVTLNQSTLSGNSTTGTGASGGGVYATYGDVTLNQSTLTGNSTAGADSDGGGIYIVNSSQNPTVTIRNSIIAGNTVGLGSVGPDLEPHLSSVVTVNYSLIGTGVTPTSQVGNIFTDDPKLGPLADNGGPTQTHALLPGSPALEGGDFLAGAVITSTQLEFSPASEVSYGGFTAADEYSIEILFSFDAIGGFQKIIDFHNLADDNGLYAFDANLDFFGTGIGVVSDLFSANTPVHLVVTRDAATDVVVVYAEGVEIMTFLDDGDIAVFSGPNQLMRFFQDDNATGGAEEGSGLINRVRIFTRDLSAGEVAALVFDQRGPGFARTVDADGIDGPNPDIGAYEAQVNPSADFDGDGDVDGRDFLAWQRGHSLVATATRGDGDSDDDSDVDASDLAAWQVQYGATGLNDLVAAVTATSTEPISEPSIPPTLEGASLIDAAMALAMMDRARNETAVVIARETTLNDEVFATIIEPMPSALPLRYLPALSLAFEETGENEIVADLWLTEELFEGVFGGLFGFARG